ncbi:MAG: hypothetical protein AAFV33_11340 [Chloroflexota bacterium]
MMRYIRAFFKALAMTVRGETIESAAELQFPRLFAWIREGRTLADAAMQAAEVNGYDEAARKQLTVQVDGRTVSMDVIMKSVKFHLEDEYPYMLEHLTEHSITGVYAANLNDRYGVLLLAEENLPEPLKAAVITLSQHLDTIPPSTEVGPQGNSE